MGALITVTMNSSPWPLSYCLRQLAALLLLLTASMQAWAFQGPHRVIDWMERLDLSDEQEIKLERIDAKYLSQFQVIRSELRPGWGEPADPERALAARKKLKSLAEQIRHQKRQILSAQQLDEADKLVRKFHRKMVKKYIGKLTGGVDISSEQNARIDAGIRDLAGEFDWPLIHQQADMARVAAERLLGTVLNEGQLKSIKEEQARLMNRWARHSDWPGKHRSERGERGHHEHSRRYEQEHGNSLQDQPQGEKASYVESELDD